MLLCIKRLFPMSISIPLLIQWGSRFSSVRCQKDVYFVLWNTDPDPACALARTDHFWVLLNCKFNRFMDVALNWIDYKHRVTNLKAFLLLGRAVRSPLGLSAKLYPPARGQCCKFRTNPRHMDQGYYFLKDWQGPYYIFSSTTPGPEASFSTITFSYKN